MFWRLICSSSNACVCSLGMRRIQNAAIPVKPCCSAADRAESLGNGNGIG
ncbi:hypothetical protein DAI22_11g220600 [Oryza sativa Japonica Group]|nr:hypothetical protein DAI22_11g220600 [Oryza sativa Japonica Group]